MAEEKDSPYVRVVPLDPELDKSIQHAIGNLSKVIWEDVVKICACRGLRVGSYERDEFITKMVSYAGRRAYTHPVTFRSVFSECLKLALDGKPMPWENVDPADKRCEHGVRYSGETCWVCHPELLKSSRWLFNDSDGENAE